MLCHEETADSSRCIHCGSAPLLQERYALKRVLGSGGSGTLYAAVDGEQGVEVAIKERWLRPDSEACKGRGEGSGSFAAAPPADSGFKDAFESGRGPGRRRYLVQSLIPGRDLEAGKKSAATRSARSRRSCSRWQDPSTAATQPPVVHRDLKPTTSCVVPTVV